MTTTTQLELFDSEACAGCGKDLEDPHEQHDEGCQTAAEREGAR